MKINDLIIFLQIIKTDYSEPINILIWWAIY